LVGRFTWEILLLSNDLSLSAIQTTEIGGREFDPFNRRLRNLARIQRQISLPPLPIDESIAEAFPPGKLRLLRAIVNLEKFFTAQDLHEQFISQSCCQKI
jgi:hypothetical protein